MLQLINFDVMLEIFMQFIVIVDILLQCCFPTAMKEIIQYFETHCRRLDHQQQCDDMCSAAAPPIITTESFISCIRFNGVPILPPVVSSFLSETYICIYNNIIVYVFKSIFTLTFEC